MACCLKGNNRNTRKAVLRFYRKELLYDIGNYCYAEADSMQASDEHEKHPVFDVCEEGNVDRVTRVLDLVFNQAVELCYPYSKREVGEFSSRDDEFTEEAEYVMLLNIPPTFSETTVTLLEKAVHELLVCRAVADWLSITKPGSEAKWEKKAEEAQSLLKSTLHGRMGRVRRTLTPFG